MTSEQYRLLLQDLARVAGMADAKGLLENGRVRIGEFNALLVHEPTYDEDLLQVRILLGGFPAEQSDIVAKALLEANYVSGFGGECVFSLFPDSDDVVITMRMRLHSSLRAQELWQELSDIAKHGSQMWQGIAAAVQPAPGSFLPHLQSAEGQRV
ncbi:MAG TPA: CesT family type III secretion system chaperone [Ramlibacter sp.]|uniref:CesT family type III secretion system chaperone n=1 Tax=Ramlibacter sp. TaxID=1917967 RepID=UPI002CA03022|nr:CesT family type III secretion system chaperone [Ramlibacter sp.]HVZ45011.1 CesT family type III secretion system chaperone [Ramlibacter sp.]